MGAIILIGAVALFIVIAALRIILGWILPRAAVAAIDAFFDAAGRLYLKLVIIGVAAFIVIVVYFAITQAPPAAAP